MRMFISNTSLKFLHFCVYASILSLIACSDDMAWNEKPEIPEGDGVASLQIKMDIASMAGVDDLESKIIKVRIIGFRSIDGGIKLNAVYPNAENADPTNILQEIKTGYTDICIIANETPEMTKNLDVVSTLTEVRQQVLASDDFGTFVTRDSLAKYGLPMYKEYESLPIKVVHTHDHPYLLAAEVDRIMAKLTLRIANSSHKEIKLDSIKVQSLPKRSWLFPSEYTDETLATSAILLTPNSDNSAYNEVNLYMPEYVLTDLSKKSYLDIRGVAKVGSAVNDTIHCSYKISLGNGLSDYRKEPSVIQALSDGILKEKDFYIVRNTHYNITVSDIKGYGNDKLTFWVGVNPWVNVRENAYEGGVWKEQPTSQRIPIHTGTSFTAKFIHTDAPYIVYNWYLSQYKQTNTDKEPGSPTIELLKSETLKNKEKSTLEFVDALPTESGEIYCEAAPIGGQHFRKSNSVTLMVIGDWDGGGKDIFPEIQNWIPKKEMPLGASYLLRDTRDNKIYRTKRMADGNWWMIQDLSYGNASTLEEFYNNGLSNRMLNIIADGTYGVACNPETNFGGLLYNSYAAVQKEDDWPLTLDGAKAYSVKGLCPDGWHLPGNKNNIWNEEWNVLEKGLEGFSLKKFKEYNYYESMHFNSYNTKYFSSDLYDITYSLVDDKTTCFFQAGFAYLRRSFGVIGFGFNEDPADTINKGPYTPEIHDLFPADYGYIVRCIRDYTK